ncbi:unnamed protein product [Gongylonema pulchrum]|uniref:NAD-dependent protein deacetylase n=1 Tax=Gongylonema pulchrum TaxID=637853 RepID=A0A183DNA4_9BILA|nr:unnamed protein product [Gongylonema pulchrum]
MAYITDPVQRGTAYWAEYRDIRQKLSSLTIEGVAEYIRDNKAKNIIVLTGAGISTSAGVPDFRSPGTGLYNNVSQFNLPDPMAIFDIRYFKLHPEPFYRLAKDLFPKNLKPTPCHYFIRLLDQKGLLLRWYTQNIDSLEFATGIDTEKLVTAHGCHHTSTCLSCEAKYDQDWIMSGYLTEKLFVEDVEVARCDKCSGIVKPDIVFFGEDLPPRFFSCAKEDFPKCDLLMIMGTSLVVHPFAGLTDEVNDDVPRLLINLSPVGQKNSSIFGFITDVFWKGKTDNGVWKLVELLGWTKDFKNLMETGRDKADEKFAEGKATSSVTSNGTGNESVDSAVESVKRSDEEPTK